MAPKTLPSRDLVRQLLSYDADTGEFTWLPRPREMFHNNRTMNVWNARYAGKAAGGFKKHGYLYIAIGRTKFLAHRLAWLIHHGAPVPNGLDHADGNSWNNAIGNLRGATQAQNMANARLLKPSATGVKGVWRANQRDGFCARINHNGHAFHLGTFTTVEAAAAARREAAVRLHGKFARSD